MDSATRSSILAEAITWYGTPFHKGAMIKGVAVDCGAFIYSVFKQTLGIPHEPFPKGYAEDWSVHKDNNEIYLGFMKPYVKEILRPQPADLVVWKFGRNFGHGTIYMGSNRYIHAYGRTGIGGVQISQKNFFLHHGRLRESKAFTLSDKWLSSFHQP